LAGNRLEVSTAIFTNHIYANKLLTLELELGAHGRENVYRVARIFAAISKCANGLHDLYTRLANDEDSVTVPGVEFPSPTPLPPGPCEEIHQLKFICKLDRVYGTRLIKVDKDNERHAIYLAKRDRKSGAGDDTVLVKFTSRYNQVAHRLLFDQELPLAPALYSCTRVIGDLTMVVMEYLEDARPLHWFFSPFSTGTTLPKVDIVRRDLEKALQVLHKDDFVFYDLRQANVLYSPKDGGRTFLVDFDGVGKDGKDRYSPCLNPNLDLGVSGSQIMRKSHDLSNLEKVVKWLSDMVA
jgi:hypothetical protein